MQNAGIEELGLDWRYLAFDVQPTELADAINGAKAMRYIGLNLTVPHKLLALPLVDELDETAKTWGAVNTIRFEASEDGTDWRPISEVSPESIRHVRSRGFNTDADAIVQSIREDLQTEIRGSSMLLLGAGGAGRVAALRLAAEDIRSLFLVNRTEAKAVEIAIEISKRFPGVHVQIGYPKESIDLVLNATSLGLKPDDSLPFDPKEFDLRRARMAYDMIYRPATTPFLSAATAAGCKVSNGLGMLLYQGAKALEIWSGKTAPIPRMREALHRHVYGG
jgi:shikimate dehydrogenase